jgi:hypothetical protein
MESGDGNVRVNPIAPGGSTTGIFGKASVT